MTNRCLLFTQCAITVEIFSAQNVMHYLLHFFFKHPIMAACNFPVSIYRVSRLPFQRCVIRLPASLLLPFCASKCSYREVLLLYTPLMTADHGAETAPWQQSLTKTLLSSKQQEGAKVKHGTHFLRFCQ